MTKKILLGLGATTALVGTSFAIVSCANEKTATNKKTATITYNKKAFIASKDFVRNHFYTHNDHSNYDQTDYVSEIRKPYNKGILDAIFTSSRAGAIAKIDVVNSYSYSNSGINVKFTLTPAKGFTLNQTVFVIVYDDGTEKATITYNQKAFTDSKTISGVDTQSSYLTEIKKQENEDKLDAIFTSNPEGAIDSITVAQFFENNVKFTLTAAEGFTLNQTVFVIVYADGTEKA